MTQEPRASVSRTGYISLIGRPNVGKSTLLNHLIGQKLSITSRRAQTTRHRIHGILTKGASQFIFVDTPGFQKNHLNALNRSLNRTVLQALKDIDLILWVVEALKYTPADEEMLNLLSKSTPVILAINKIDLVAKGNLLPIMESYSQLYSFKQIIP
ncbi:MAG: GTPase Era, partial [Pseudomonadota bacterium]|nr:GTPase Era [Pseudomonadota bacterium]